MKTYLLVFASLFTAMFVFSGCNKSGSIDTTALENSFQSAESTTKASADKAIAALKAQDYSGALSELKTLASNAKLTPEQQQSIKDVMAKVQQSIADVASKAGAEATKGVDDLKKSISK